MLAQASRLECNPYPVTSRCSVNTRRIHLLFQEASHWLSHLQSSKTNSHLCGLRSSVESNLWNHFQWKSKFFRPLCLACYSRLSWCLRQICRLNVWLKDVTILFQFIFYSFSRCTRAHLHEIRFTTPFGQFGINCITHTLIDKYLCRYKYRWVFA